MTNYLNYIKLHKLVIIVLLIKDLIMSKKVLTPIEHLKYSEQLQILVLQYLAETLKDAKACVFQGGTCIHLAWLSPRYSEDLDFLVRADAIDVLKQALIQVQQKLNLFIKPYWGGDIILKARLKEDNPVKSFMFTWGDVNTIGSVKVKCEFFQVDPELYQQYPSAIKALSLPNDTFISVKPLLHVGTVDSLLGDKLKAIGTRITFKVRDAFDIWYLKQTPYKVDNIQKQMATNIQMYKVTMDDVYKGWSRFYDLTENDITQLMHQDLIPYLPPTITLPLATEVRESVVSLMKEVQPNNPVCGESVSYECR